MTRHAALPSRSSIFQADSASLTRGWAERRLLEAGEIDPVSRWNKFRFARYVFLLVAYGALALSGYFLLSRTIFWIQAESAVGTVIGWREMKVSSTAGRATGSNRAYAVAVRFVAANGEEYDHVADWGSESAAYRRGEQVTVLYDRDNPGRAMIRGFVSMYLGPLLLLPMALAFGFAAVVMESLGDSKTKRRPRRR